MAYRNKTFVSFASEDIASYRLMTAWIANENIDFNFHDAHDLNTALATSQPETIRRRIRERLANTKQIVLLIGDQTRAKAADPSSFIFYEMDVINNLLLPVVIANLNQSRESQRSRLPAALRDPYTMSVSFRPKIIQYALENFPAAFTENLKASKPKTGPYYYKKSIYDNLGL